jgi:hypothetical protein
MPFLKGNFSATNARMLSSEEPLYLEILNQIYLSYCRKGP